MTREERCQLAIEKGLLYDKQTGKIFGVRGNELTTKNSEGYIIIALYKNSKRYELKGHQFAWYCINKQCINQIDHINGIRDDNRICNLRNVTNQENHMNRTTAKGYTWNKDSNKWLAQIRLNGKQINLGRFENEEDARAAYLKAKEKYHKIN